MSESFAELFEESLLTLDMKPGTLVTGEEITNETGLLTANDIHKSLKKKTVPCVYYHSA